MGEQQGVHPPPTPTLLKGSIGTASLEKNYRISLNVDKISGNPIKGYTMDGFTLSYMNSEDIFEAETLNVRVSITALITGNIRLAELSIDGISLDVEKFLATVNRIELSSLFTPKSISLFSVNPAFADDMPNIPIDRIILHDSHFHSKIGVFAVKSLIADITALNIEVDGAINGLPLRGKIDMSSFKTVNRSEFTLGNGKIIATGEFDCDNLDIHMSGENFTLEDIAYVMPDIVVNDLSVTASFSGEITGTTKLPRWSFLVNLGCQPAGLPFRAYAHISYWGKRLSVNNISATVLNLPITGEIVATFFPDEPVAIMVKLDGNEAMITGLDDLLGKTELRALTVKVSKFNVNMSGPINSMSGQINVNGSVSYGSKRVKDIRLQAKMSGSDIAKVDGKFTYDGEPGYISGSIASIKAKPETRLTSKIVSVKVESLTALIPALRSTEMSGDLTLLATIVGRGKSFDVRGELRGNELMVSGKRVENPVIDFNIKDGRITFSSDVALVNGYPLSIGGRVTPILSDEASIDMTATIRKPCLKYGYIDGEVEAGYRITGLLSDPTVRMILKSPIVKVMDVMTLEGLEVIMSEGSSEYNFSVDISARAMKYAGIELSEVNAMLKRGGKGGDEIELIGMSGKNGDGMVSATGKLSLSGITSVDLRVMCTDFEIGTLSSLRGIGVDGKLSGTLRMTGNNENPVIEMRVDMPKLKVKGISISGINIGVYGDKNKLRMRELRCEAGGTAVTGSGDIELYPSKRVKVKLMGKGIDLGRLLRESNNFRGKIAGKAGISMNISGDAEGVRIESKISSPVVTVRGIKFRDIEIPLMITGWKVVSKVEDMKIYGGNVSNVLIYDIEGGTFTDDLYMYGVKVNEMLHGMRDDISGNVVGDGEMTLMLSGTTGERLSYEGTGNFSMGRGEITGFNWLKLFGVDAGLRYSEVRVPFEVKTGLVTVKAGSIMRSEKGEELYKYCRIKRDGEIDFRGEKVSFDLLTEGKVSGRVIEVLGGAGVKGDYGDITLRVYGEGGAITVYGEKGESVSSKKVRPEPKRKRSEKLPIKVEPKRDITIIRERPSSVKIGPAKGKGNEGKSVEEMLKKGY